MLCRRGSRNLNKLVSSATKATYTVLMFCNAIDDFLPMFINYKWLHLYSTWSYNGLTNARYNCSSSSWMEAAQFFDWFINSYTSHLVQPLDVGVYKALKQSWRRVLREYYQETGYKNVEKLMLPSLMKNLQHSGCLSRANAIGGFNGSGIYSLCKENMMKKVHMAEMISKRAKNEDDRQSQEKTPTMQRQKEREKQQEKIGMFRGSRMSPM
ncbi:hypothetical protein ILUMI_14096 [Ignelater luminosus]|uniref:Uncharacterized protein n=1 Tax=Ignelater luminosus TaxID=2038154 RepID=A0A8K0G826_IGNLU|nr:hypothetical protein ILUMI_14096 [Ignelater luminosus]